VATSPRAPRIALFDPYLDALGGGEKYLLRFGEVIAGALSVPVTLLVHRDHNRPDLLERLRRYYGLRLAGFSVRQIGPSRANLLSHLRLVWETRRYDLLVYLCNGVPKPSLARRSVAAAQFPFLPRTAAELAPWQRWSLSRYEIVVNSRFTERWVERRWGRRATVVPPPASLDPPPGEAPARAPIIVNVGRFFRKEHSKKQREMVEAFARLRAGGLAGWELHLAGTVPEAGLEYFEEIRSLGAPGVVLHPNAPLEEIVSLYQRASLYWHATGAGVDEEMFPEHMEHFGMTTVEAMAFGCVPVVIGKGGQAEIVRDGECGYLCRDLDEMQARTRRLIGEPALLASMSAAARRRSHDFDDHAFERAVRGWLGGTARIT
jgi:glycosyltransferase involved in cell wall biosynthesis